MTREQKLKAILENPILFCSVFCKIVDKHGRMVKFIPNETQKEIIKEIQNEKYLIILKSRQKGCSVIADFLSIYYAIKYPNSNCLLVSYSLDSVNTIFQKLKQIFNSIPDCIRPKEITNNRKEISLANGSCITVTTMGSKEISRGSSLRFVHISEGAFCKKEIFTKNLLAIEQALLPDDDAHLIIESTANGIDNDFYELYTNAENGNNLYKAKFFSWISDREMFADEYKSFSKKWTNTHGHALTVEELEPIEKSYYDMGADLQQLMWRRMKIANMGRNGESKFKAEFPASPIEAWVTTGNNIFNAEKIMQEYNERKNIPTIKKIDNLVPVLKSFLNNFLTVWELPQVGTKYIISGDFSEGVGEDFTVIDVYSIEGSQVAQFRSNKVQPYVCAEVVYQLAIYYNKGLIIIEKASGGNLALSKLKTEYKYPNLYRHKEWDSRGKCVKKIGFNTTPKTKPILINDFVEFFENDDLYIRSLATFQEMRTYIFTNGTMNGEIGTHDDAVISSALAVCAMKNGIFYL